VTAREEHCRIAYRIFSRWTPKAAIARSPGVSYVTVWRWESRRNTEDSDSWRYHDHPGSERRLSALNPMTLLEVLKRGARVYGYPTNLWTLKRMAEANRKEYRVEYTMSGV